MSQKKTYVISILLITFINVILRVIFIAYGYITTDEGIALYNAKLAYKGLMPFIDYNGWNSLITDYIVGATRFISTPSILSLRIFGALLALLVFVLSLQICRNIGSRKQVILTAFLLTLASPFYLYYSNIPYSTQVMTLFMMGSLLLITPEKATKFKPWKDICALMLAVLNIAVRSQMIPVFICIYLYILFKRWKHKKYIGFLSIYSLTFGFIIFAPFFTRSIEKTLYGLFWPFFAQKLLIYVADINGRNLSQLTNFLINSAREYGLLTIMIWSTLLTKMKTYRSRLSYFSLLFSIIAFALFTALIHIPADATYLYPFVPILAILAGFVLNETTQEYLPIESSNFLVAFICLTAFVNFLSYPHFVYIKTSLKDRAQTPHDHMREISKFIYENTGKNDQIFSFYMPVIAEIDREVPIRLNEGAGSISILDSATAKKYNLTSQEELLNIIDNRQVKLIIYNDSSLYYFGRTVAEREDMLTRIMNNYTLVRKFPNFHLADGSKATNLYIYSLR